VFPLQLTEPRGRGLWLLDQLATRWDHQPREDAPGRKVWFEVDPSTAAETFARVEAMMASLVVPQIRTEAKGPSRGPSPTE
jgi:hypothetical protein